MTMYGQEIMMRVDTLCAVVIPLAVEELD